MKFTKYTSKGGSGDIAKLLIKFVLIILLLFLGLILLNRIDFPAPNKKIEKIIPNENFKTVK
tara:strand:+ start:892 stop:1077 length:186 start_codon:yes stop_codon:yes gene_type:complete